MENSKGRNGAVLLEGSNFEKTGPLFPGVDRKTYYLSPCEK